ncbi:coiled-coil domain-containing protein 191 [Leucoraja erinacea]|uniref:coiled-coil domain-containing protein 191 n=1 Tax=Leucoraja erinaceus TaxID=7782 RepID=UPI002454DFD4|nr:coiled-coil domain-containing protein 191 [Leucoraja erinacea]
MWEEGEEIKHDKPGLFRWKRFTKNQNRAKQNLDYDDIQDWMKRVEKASDCAVAEVFPSKKLNANPKVSGYVMTMETVDQLHDHDDAYAEAHELLNEWMNSKLRMELEYEEDGELDNHMKNSEAIAYSPEMFSKMPEYEKFDDLYNYLDQEKESTAAQAFLQQLLEKKVEESGILDDLGIDEESQQKKRTDPCLSMEARHQQVKENRVKRQARLEQQKQEKSIKKFAHAKAHQLIQEENRQKALQAKKEEEQIKKEMVLLRKEMMDKRCIMEEAKRLEREHQKKEKKQKILVQEKAKQALIELQKLQNQERREVWIKQENDARIKTCQLRCLQKHFSIWYKLVLERRIKMGKARALFDWKSQLRIFQAWRTYTWEKKLEQEVQRTEMELREEKRKKQLAIECNRKHRLRYCFTNWLLWCKAEKEKRALEAQKEETKQKMAALLDSASSVKLSTVSNGASRFVCDVQQVVPAKNAVVVMKKQDSSPTGSSLMTDDSKTHQLIAARPKFAWQVTRKHATLKAEDIMLVQNESKISDGDQDPNSGIAGKTNLHVLGNFKHRHVFQQQLIEDQKKQLQEKQKIIEELQEKQQLTILQQDAKLASAITTAIVSATQKMRLEPNPHGTKPTGNVQLEMKDAAAHTFRSIVPSSAEETSCCTTGTNNMISPHPIVKAMEERAKQRMARRKELEEIKRKKEKDKLAHLRAKEEERQMQQEAEKQALLEKKREEKRLQRQKETEKQLRLEKQGQMLSAAEKHYQDFLLNKRGLQPWRKVIEISKQNMKFAEAHHATSLVREYLCTWHQNVSESLSEKKLKAEKVYNGILLKRCLNSWLKCKEYTNVMEKRAIQHYLTGLRRSIFTVWCDYVTMEKTATWEKERIAAEHNQRRLVNAAFMAWKTLPIFAREEKIKEERIKELRKKVAEILPDFLK